MKQFIKLLIIIPTLGTVIAQIKEDANCPAPFSPANNTTTLNFIGTTEPHVPMPTDTDALFTPRTQANILPSDLELWLHYLEIRQNFIELHRASEQSDGAE